MASAQETLELILSARDQSSGAFNSFTRSLDRTKRDIDRIAGPIANVAKKFLLLEAAAGAAAAAILGFAIKEAATLEDVMVDLEKVFNGTNVLSCP